MKRIFLLITLTTLSLISCNSNPVDAEENLPPGRRDYVWTVDTLESSLSPFIRIWGSSPNDVWCVKNGGIWHFDGFIWRELNEAIYPQTIFGFDQNNVWAAAEGKFWHYDGKSWQLFSQHITNPSKPILFQNLWGNKPNNIFAIGSTNIEEYYPILMHFDGTAWNFINTVVNKLAFVYISIDRKYPNMLILIGHRFESNFSDTSKILLYANSNFDIIYEGVDDAVLNNIAGDVYIIIKDKIYSIENTGLKLYKDMSGFNFLGRIWGRNKKDIFTLFNTGLAHYNGVSYEVIYEIDPLKINFFNAQIFEDAVFFLLYDTATGNNLILRGYLSK